jgi:hypothetical protein
MAIQPLLWARCLTRGVKARQRPKEIRGNSIFMVAIASAGM